MKTCDAQQHFINDFARRIAKEMLKLSSSYVFFIMQQAYGNRFMDWEEAESLLKKQFKWERKNNAD